MEPWFMNGKNGEFKPSPIEVIFAHLSVFSPFALFRESVEKYHHSLPRLQSKRVVHSVPMALEMLGPLSTP
jgi:hypothetical protein